MLTKDEKCYILTTVNSRLESPCAKDTINRRNITNGDKTKRKITLTGINKRRKEGIL